VLRLYADSSVTGTSALERVKDLEIRPEPSDEERAAIAAALARLAAEDHPAPRAATWADAPPDVNDIDER